MNPLRSALVTARRWRASQLHLPRNRVGTITVTDEGQAFTVYRETAIDAGTDADPPTAVLAFRFHLRFMPSVLVPYAVGLFEPLSILTTPFFAGLPGFRTKLWQFDHETGDYQGLYEWASAAQARSYAAGLRSIMDLLALPGSVSYEVLEDVTLEAYLAAHSPARSRRTTRRRTVRRLLTAAVAVALALGGSWLLERRWQGRQGGRREGPPAVSQDHLRD